MKYIIKVRTTQELFLIVEAPSQDAERKCYDDADSDLFDWNDYPEWELLSVEPCHAAETRPIRCAVTDNGEQIVEPKP